MGYNYSITLRIDWSDLDLFGHVNNVAFFKYIQAARVDVCESFGLSSLNEAGKLSFMVVSSQCHFKKPLLFPGTVQVLVNVAAIRNTSFELTYTLQNELQETVAQACDVLVVFDHHRGTKLLIDETLKQKLASI